MVVDISAVATPVVVLVFTGALVLLPGAGSGVGLLTFAVLTRVVPAALGSANVA